MAGKKNPNLGDKLRQERQGAENTLRNSRSKTADSSTGDSSKKKEQSFKTEHIILHFLNKRDLPILKKDRETLWEKLSPEINSLHNDKYENQLLRIFDFTAWIEAKILKEKLSDVLARHSEVKKYHSK